MLLLSIAVAAVLVLLTYYYMHQSAVLVESKEQLDCLKGLKKLKYHALPIDFEPSLVLPIIAKWSKFYISQLRLTDPNLIINSDTRLLIFNLTFDILAVSIFSTQTDSLASQLVSSDMTISLIRLNDMMKLYQKRRTVPYYLWLYHDLWEGSISMANNTAYLKSLVHKAKKCIDEDESYIKLLVRMYKDEEKVLVNCRNLFMGLMATIPNAIYDLLLEISQIDPVELKSDQKLEKLILRALSRNPPVKEIIFKGYVINIAEANLKMNHDDLTFGNETVGICPAKEPSIGLLLDIVKGLTDGFTFGVKNAELVITKVL